MLGEPWLLALLASALIFRSWLVPTNGCLIASRKRLPAALLCAIRGSLGRIPPFWSTVQALQARPRYAHILLAGAGGGGAAFANTHV